MSAFFDELWARYKEPDTFVRRLRDRMRLHNITQGQLAERSGYDRPHVSRWLNLRRKPDMGTMAVLDEAVDNLINGT